MTALRRFADEDQWSGYYNSGNQLAQTRAHAIAMARPQLSSPSYVGRANWQRETVDRLLTLVPLRDNWDQRGSAAVRGDALSFAWTVLTQIMPHDGIAPVIIPLGNGGIQLEWSHPSGVELEIEIARPFEISAFYFDTRDGADIEDEIDTRELDALSRLLRLNFRQ